MPHSTVLRSRSFVLLPLALLLGVALSLLAATLGVPAASAQEGASLEVHVAACPAGYTGSAIFEDCHGAGVADVEVAIASADGTVSQGASTTLPATPGPGVATFSGLPAGTFSLALGLDPAAGRYATFCTDTDTDTDTDAIVPLDPGDAPTGTITLADGQAVVCDVYLIPPTGLDATDLLTALTTLPLTLPEIATADTADGETDAAAGAASVTVTPLICPPGTEAPNGYVDLAGVCTTPLTGVTFTWGAGGTAISTHDSDDAPLVIDGIAPGSYTLVSGIPLEFAREALFCTADGGDRYQKSFDERGVTMFQNFQREEIACEWFVMPFALTGDLGGVIPTEAPATTTAPTTAPVVTPTPEPTAVASTSSPTPLPETARGVETGASLEIHLGLCPPGYTGDALFATCHDAGVSDQTYTLTGPNGTVEAVTTVPSSPGPGIVVFTGLAAGDYTLVGGPPGDFGGIRLYCTAQPDGAAVDATTEDGVASLALGDGQDVLCDWYFIPVNQGGPTETATVTPTTAPTPVPARSDIAVTLLACPAGTDPADSDADLQGTCTERIEGIAFALTGAGAPIDAVSRADGGVRFGDLPPGDYTLRASLPSDLASATVQCRLNDGDPYRKALADGGTTFVNVDGDVVTCAWFLIPVEDDTDPATPAGSITIREFICEGDAADITDWDAQCAPGRSGANYTIRPYAMSFERTGQPDGNGVVTVAELPDGLYTVLQDGGMWCRARAERVDSQSRVIVEGGRNTDLHLYQCDDVVALPNTGAGPGAGATGSGDIASIGPMVPAASAVDPGAWWRAAQLPEILALGAGLMGVGILIGWTRTRYRIPHRMNRRAASNVE